MEVAASPIEVYMAQRKERATNSLAKRCLFGQPTTMDRARTHRKLSEQTAVFQREFLKSWGFDCSNELPVEGGSRFEWELVGQESRVPSVYHKMVQVTCYPNMDTELPSPSKDQEETRRDSGIYSSSDEQNDSVSSVDEEENTQSSFSPSPVAVSGKRKRKMTDYYRCVKRRVTVSSSSSSAPKSVKRLH